jgi:sugar phosphate permease
VVAAVTFVVLLAAAGARAAPGVVLVPLGNEFQWSRAKVASIVSINIFLYGLVGPFAAALYQRFGLRKVMAAALLLLCGGYGLSTLATQYWQFVLLWGVVVGLGSGMAATVLGAAVASRWFTARRGLVMGVLTASTATGQLIFLPSLASAAEANGWRTALLLVGAAAAMVVPLVLWLMRNDPRDVGQRPYGETTDTAASAEASARQPSDATTKPEGRNREVGPKTHDMRGGPASVRAAAIVSTNPAVLAINVLRDAVRVRDFWLLAGSFFVCGASTNGLIGTHLIAASFDCGIPEVRAASLLAMMGLFDLVGTTASGWLSDRYSCRALLFMYYGLRGLSLMFLPQALIGPTVGLGVFAVFYGLDWIATVPPTVRLTSDVFGREKAAIVFGWIAASHQIGAAFAAFTAGAVRSLFGTYSPAFIGAGILCLLAALIVLPIARSKPVALAAA